jgi:penicillin-insensitive murein endopeptidase
VRVVLGLLVLAGCAELGAISDGTSVSVGKASGGYLLDGARLPDHGVGFVTREVWQQRGNRYGTDELIDLITGVARRMKTQVKDVQLVIADLSARNGGGSYSFHRSHQSGRDADIVYYMRDADGKSFEADAMHEFDAGLHARDGTGLTVDVPRTWQLVKELITAPEAPVQFIFMYEPIALRVLEHAKKRGEPEALIARARKTLRQPGDSARHDDHMHVRVYCSAADKLYGCEDYGPMELLAEREAERAAMISAIAVGAELPANRPDEPLVSRPVAEPDRSVLPSVDASSLASVSEASSTSLRPLGSLLRTRVDRVDLRWR